MEDCPHIHQEVEGLKTFRDHINEVTDGGICGRCGRCAAGLKSPTCRGPQSWTDSLSALSAALAAGAAGFSRVCSPTKVSDSPKLIQANSILGTP